MKNLILLFTLLSFSSCYHKETPEEKIAKLTAEVKMLKEKYKPTISDLMIEMQMHHAKLWYAATNNNWQLSEYEIEKIKESIKRCETFYEVRRYPRFEVALDGVLSSIKKSNIEEFKTSYQYLTMECNLCHKVNAKQFNLITIPTAPPVSNQDFEKTSWCRPPIMPKRE